MNFRQPVGGAGRHPLLVQVVVDHDRSPGRGDALLGSFVTARDKRESYQDYILLGHYRMLYIVVHFFSMLQKVSFVHVFYVCLLLMIVHSICIVSIFVASILRDYLLCANLVVQRSKKGKPPSAQDLMKPLLPSCTCTIAAAETSMIYRW